MPHSQAGGLQAEIHEHLRAGTSEDRATKQWRIPGALDVEVPGSVSPGHWEDLVREADRAACRAWRQHLIDEWGGGWTVVVDDLRAAIHVDGGTPVPRLRDARAVGVQPDLELVVPAAQRTAMSMRVPGGDSFLLTSGATFGSGPSATAVYRGEGMANVDAIALQVLSAGPDEARLLVVDRRGVTVRKRGLFGGKQQVPQRATVTVAAGDRVGLGPVTLEVD